MGKPHIRDQNDQSVRHPRRLISVADPDVVWESSPRGQPDAAGIVHRAAQDQTWKRAKPVSSGLGSGGQTPLFTDLRKVDERRGSTVSWVQAQATEMMAQRGFLGVPVETFEDAGRRQFIALLNQGLCPESKVLDIGCGCLRTAYWLVRFLDPNCYHGIEPARSRVEHGLHHLFVPELLAEKRPRFDFNPDFDSSAFATEFDYFLAGSIWSHASKRQIEATLDLFLRDSIPSSIFLTSYLPALSAHEDYCGDHWVGTSHVSHTPGVIRHALVWITQQCERRGLDVEELPGEAFDAQYWLRVSHR
jgi:hypothetical protein